MTSSRPLASKSHDIGWTMSGAAATSSTTSRGSLTLGTLAGGWPGSASTARRVSRKPAAQRAAHFIASSKSMATDVRPDCSPVCMMTPPAQRQEIEPQRHRDTEKTAERDENPLIPELLPFVLSSIL